MANSPPEKRRCTKNAEKRDVVQMKGKEKDVDNVDETRDDSDDAVLLSQAMDEGAWIAPTQPDKASFLSGTLREDVLKQFDEIPFAGDAHMLTQEINRLRKQLGNSIGENQMLTYKVKNLNRENALLQDNLIQIQRTFEQRFLEQKIDFEKTERSMQNMITYQEQDLRTKEFRDRLNNSASNATEIGHAEVTETSGDARQDSLVIRLKKVSIPSFRRGNGFPRTLNNSPILRKAFAHCRSVLNDTFRATDSQGRSVNNTTSSQHDNNDAKGNRNTPTSSQQEIQTTNPNLYNCLVYLRPDNQLPQLYGICDEMITLGFRSIFPELFRNRELRPTRLMHDVLAEPRKRWCR
uniref:Csm1 domain-containing protein n=1 Tax=Elaeophora elaphi TaxID=1147741 RepID=A0A0R3S1K6_9BILA